MTDDLLGRVRSVCLGFPESSEETTWGHQTFRVRGKIFAMFSEIGPEDGDRSGAAELVEDSYRLVAPKRLSGLLDE